MGGPLRQLCDGSMKQIMEDAGAKVTCPCCLRSFASFDTQRNRSQVCPIVPSHLPDRQGLLKVEAARTRTATSTPRPF